MIRGTKIFRNLSDAARLRVEAFDRSIVKANEQIQEVAMEIFGNQETTVDYLLKKAEEDRERTSLIFDDVEFSRGWIADTLNQTSNLVKGLELEDEDVIAYLSFNSEDFISTVSGISASGAIPALINTSMKGSALKHSIELTNAKYVFVGGDPAHHEALENLNLNIPIISKSKNYGLGLLDELRNKESKERDEENVVGPMDTFSLIYTSGTTGLPKAAVKKHFQPALSAHAGRIFYGYTEEDMMQNDLPLFHFSGLLNSIVAMSNGAKVCLTSKFSPSKAVETFTKKYPITHMMYIGETIRYINNTEPTASDRGSKLRICLGNGLERNEWVKFNKRFGEDIWMAEVYGATELPFILCTPPNEEGKSGCTDGAISRLTPTFQEVNGLRLVKKDPNGDGFLRDANGHLIEVGFNEPGIIIMKVSDTFQYSGYFNNEEKTNEKIIENAFGDGEVWVDSGDMLEINEEYEIFFCDRLGDTYRWKGENISAAEVERGVLESGHFTEAVAYGIKVEGNEGRMGVIAGKCDDLTIEKMENIAKVCKDNLHHAACPRIYRVVDDLPVTDTFKYKKAVIKEEPISPGDFFVSKEGKVTVLDEQTIHNLLGGKLNDLI